MTIETNATRQAAIGTLPWARETLGALSPGDNRALFLQALRLQARMLGSLLFRRGCASLDEADVAEIAFPDSATAQRAIKVCAEVSPTSLFHHCCRAYVWSRILALVDGIRYDDELLFTACMLHDLGLTPAYTDCGRHAACFTLDSVEGASAVAKESGWDARRQDALAEAILLHMNVVVDVKQGAEAHLLHEAAALDCLGLRTWEIAPRTRTAVVNRFPREGLKSLLFETFGNEVLRRPQGRAAFLKKYLFLFQLVRWSPFEE